MTTASTSRGALVLGFAALAASLSHAENALAAPLAHEPVRLTIRPTPCTDEASFWDAVSRRTARVQRAAEGEKASAVDIEIVRDGQKVVGRLRVTGANAGSEARASRTVSGDTCEDVVATLSLMTALVFDPEAITTVAPPPKPPSPPPPDPPQPNEPPPQPKPSIPPIALVKQPPPPPAPKKPTTARAPHEGARLHFAAGIEGGISGWGELAPGGGFFFESGFTTARSVWQPTVRLTASYAAFEASAAPATASVRWRTLRFDHCPMRLTLGSRITLRPCASFEAGALDVTAEGVRDARGITRPWLAPGARLRLAWTPTDSLLLAIDAGGAIPLIRDTFAIEPSIRLFRPAKVGGQLGLSLGFRFL